MIDLSWGIVSHKTGLRHLMEMYLMDQVNQKNLLEVM